MQGSQRQRRRNRRKGNVSIPRNIVGCMGMNLNVQLRVYGTKSKSQTVHECAMCMVDVVKVPHGRQAI